MADIGLFLTGEGSVADVRVSGSDLDTDEGLETAVLLSLFLDRRVDGERGWWADALPGVQDQTGSRLWTLQRSKDIPGVLPAATEMVREALEWLVTDGVAAAVEVQASRGDARGGMSELLLDVAVKRTSGTTKAFRYAYNWETQMAKSVTNGV